MPTMPNIPNGERAIECNAAKVVFGACLNKRTGKLKTKKPYPNMDFKHADAILHASVNYVWRILCFDLTNFRPHNCLPCTADWDIRRVFADRSLAEREAWIDTLDDAILQIESTIPSDQHKGTIEWGSAFHLLNKQITERTA
jgi:hypothetical protein